MVSARYTLAISSIIVIITNTSVRNNSARLKEMFNNSDNPLDSVGLEVMLVKLKANAD
jgi:hypothetical protein